MNIKVKVLSKRKCSASIDLPYEKRGKAILSFGDKKKPDTDVEIEFSLEQLKKLQRISKIAITNFEKLPLHLGQC